MPYEARHPLFSNKSTNDRTKSSRLHIRPIHPSDAPALRAGFDHLSDLSRYHRFHSGMRHLSDSLVRYLTEVDGIDHVALVGLLRSPDGARQGVAVGRFVRNPSAPDTAEIAITVLDAFQGRGIGRQLLAALAEAARARGIQTFTMSVISGNGRARRLLRSLGAVGKGTVSDVSTFHLSVTALASAA